MREQTKSFLVFLAIVVLAAIGAGYLESTPEPCVGPDCPVIEPTK